MFVELLGSFLKAFPRFLEGCWRSLTSLRASGASLGGFSEPSEGFLEASWGLLRASWELLRASLELGRRPWSFWGLRGGMLCALRRCLEGLAGRLDPSWDDFESFFEHFELSETDFGGFRPYVFDSIYDGFGSWRLCCIVFHDKIVKSR